jgi:predicted PurR-regulated permease PerM
MTANNRHSHALRNRQMDLALAILLLAGWVAFEFLIPVAWAAILAIAEWPIYRRAISRFAGHHVLVGMLFALGTALILLVPLSLAAVAMVEENQAALDSLQHVQQFGIAPPPWLSSIPLIGPRATIYWQQHVGTPVAANAMIGSMSASSIFAWTRSIGGEVAREFGLFLITLIALVSLLTHGKRIRFEARGRHPNVRGVWR